MGICEGGHMYGCPLAKVPVRRVSTVFYSKQNQITEEICNRLYDQGTIQHEDFPHVDRDKLYKTTYNKSA